ncbi:MAG: alanine:cation symporter family protein, partial [Clostridiales bacterium]|nr:alanine:cation symporter family protein [Clostridiales bacterium]
LVGWSVYGEKCFGYLTNDRHPKLYRYTYVILIFAGAVMKPSLMWGAADIFNGFMALPNLISLILLSREVIMPSRSGKAPYGRHQERQSHRRRCNPHFCEAERSSYQSPRFAHRNQRPRTKPR